jgi:hypothetical protein
MSDAASATLQPNSAIPADDPNRKLTVADPDSSKVCHVAVVGGPTVSSFPAHRQPDGTA